MIVSRVGRTTSGSVSLPARHELALGVDLETVMRDDRAFLGETLDVLGFLFEIAERDEEREVGVLVAGRLEHLVELRLHLFPDAVAPRLDDHAAAHVGIFRHVGGGDDRLVPLGEIDRARGRDGVLGGLLLRGVGRICVGHKRYGKILTGKHEIRKNWRS